MVKSEDLRRICIDDMISDLNGVHLKVYVEVDEQHLRKSLSVPSEMPLEQILKPILSINFSRYDIEEYADQSRWQIHRWERSKDELQSELQRKKETLERIKRNLDNLEE